MRIVGANSLGQHVTDANGFHDGAHSAAGNDAGTFRGGLQHNTAGAETAKHFTGKRAVDQRDEHAGLAGLVSGLAQGFRNFLGLTEAETDVTLAVTDDDQSGEAETTAALNNFGNAVQSNDLFDFSHFVGGSFSFFTHIRTPDRLHGRHRLPP